MKKKLLFFICLISSCILNATTIKTVKVDIDFSKMSFPYDTFGQIQIIPSGKTYFFDSDTNAPLMPYYSVSVYIPGGKEYVSSDLTYNKNLLFSCCTLAPTPEAVPTSQVQSSPNRLALYGKGYFPEHNLRYVGESKIGNSKILYFNVCPFIYDSKEKKLFTLNDIQLIIQLKESTGVQAAASIPNGLYPKDLVSGFVINPDDVHFDGPQINVDDIPNRLAYAIITSKELASAFTPLVNWKRQKGVWTEVITIEDIERSYSGKSTQEKIKNCLHSLYITRHLKYALLGGDDTIVPVRYCKVNLQKEKGEKLPVDMYYSCFGKQFDWDANKNGKFGEPEDNIDLFPNIYVSRLPIRTYSEVESYVNRVLSYEKMKNPKVWNKKMLSCGFNLSMNIGDKSDSEFYGDKIYDMYIKDFWDGERKRLYDIHNDFGYDSLNYKAIQEQLSTGYAFAEFIMHGAPWCYAMKSRGHYDINDASDQTNTGYTIISTTACCTNAFDDCDDLGDEYRDPCLSESLIRNPDSGIIAYFGGSREGWHLKDEALSLSQLYEAKFYENLFSNQYINKNFGKIAAISKANMISACKYDNHYTWIQYSLNPVGDPEMPVFTDNPKQFPRTKVKIENGKLSIDTGVDSCTVCIMSRLDGGQSYYKILHNVRTATLDYSVDSLSLCITKQNYIPYLINDVWNYCMYTIPDIPIGSITGAGKDLGTGDLSIKYKVGNRAKDAKLVVSSYDGTASNTYDAPIDENKLNIKSNLLKKEILTISLFVDSKLTDSISFNNK